MAVCNLYLLASSCERTLLLFRVLEEKRSFFPMFALGNTFAFHAKLEYFCFMMKFELCPWNFPSLFPSLFAWLSPESRSVLGLSVIKAWGRLRAMSLACPSSACGSCSHRWRRCCSQLSLCSPPTCRHCLCW